MIITCPIHGIFFQSCNGHIAGYGCLKCGNESSANARRSNTEDFVKKAIEFHGDKYDYSLVEYINNSTKVRIICNKNDHGIFEQSPCDHLKSGGCKKCRNEMLSELFSDTKEEFIRKARRAHGTKYDYSLVKYVNNSTKVKIICKNHGMFEQVPYSHTFFECGCPYCSSSKGEEKVRDFLINNGISFSQEHRFDDCKNKNKLPFDFYLKDYNLCIEFDGKQHFEPIEYFGGQKTFEQTQKRDSIKNHYCKDNDIDLIRIQYTDFKNINKILKAKLYG